MAHIKLRLDPGTEIRLLYLNDAAVGRGSPNRRDDVLLVQFFLNALWGTSPDKTTVIGSGAVPAIDGVCGTSSVPSRLCRDGTGAAAARRPSPTTCRSASSRPVRGPLHKFPYTIIGLSVDFGGAFGVDRHFRLGKEPNFPAELKRKLFF
jgi:hypothetical protein